MTNNEFNHNLHVLCKHRSYLRKHIRDSSSEYELSVFKNELIKCNSYICRLYLLKRP